jgi:DNA-binding NarL/FixJ family response regulator
VTAGLASITTAEREAIVLLASGKPIKTVAYTLQVSERTVASRLASAQAKMGVRTRIQAAVIAAKAGWI